MVTLSADKYADQEQPLITQADSMATSGTAAMTLNVPSQSYVPSSWQLTQLLTWTADSSIPAEHLAELAAVLLDHLLVSAPDPPQVQQSEGPEPAGPKAAQKAGRGRAGGRSKQAKRRQPSSKPTLRRENADSPERDEGDEEVKAGLCLMQAGVASVDQAHLSGCMAKAETSAQMHGALMSAARGCIDCWYVVRLDTGMAQPSGTHLKTVHLKTVNPEPTCWLPCISQALEVERCCRWRSP